MDWDGEERGKGVKSEKKGKGPPCATNRGYSPE